MWNSNIFWNVGLLLHIVGKVMFLGGINACSVLGPYFPSSLNLDFFSLTVCRFMSQNSP